MKSNHHTIPFFVWFANDDESGIRHWPHIIFPENIVKKSVEKRVLYHLNS